jgi:uncharacterized membrane protein
MLRQFGIALLTLVIFDGLWLGLVMKDFVYGALFGALTYAVYDLTNHAILREWTTTP